MSERAQYLYRINPTRPEMLSNKATPKEERVISEHFAYLQELTEDGVVILAGRTLNTDESSFGIVIFLTSTGAAARVVMENDPAVKQGVMKAELFPYRVALKGNWKENP